MIQYLIEITPYILQGFKMTFGVCMLTLTVSIPLSLILIVLSRIKILKTIIFGFTWIMRGTPLILQLYFFVFALPIIIPGFISKDASIAASIVFI